MNDPGVNPRHPLVLLVDDNADALKALARLLEYKGYAVRTAADGRSALAALRSWPPPEIVLTDLILPDLDGREIAANARQLVPPPYTALMTGWSLGHDLQADDSGVDDIFYKPLDFSDLLATLDEVINARGGHEPRA